MAKSKANLKVDEYISKVKKWQHETEALRSILLSCGLTEDLKWGKPCYMHQGRNIAIIQGFKEYFALLFFKGVLLNDPDGMLVKTGENTEVGRQMRFADVLQITQTKPLIKAFVKQAIEVENANLKVDTRKHKMPAFTEEFQHKLEEIPALKAAFDALTPGRQKAYYIYFSQAKQPQTRQARVNKYVQKILNGKGLND